MSSYFLKNCILNAKHLLRVALDLKYCTQYQWLGSVLFGPRLWRVSLMDLKLADSSL